MKNFLSIFVLFLFVSACKKENNASQFEGKYTGNFKVLGADDAPETPAEIILNKQHFRVTNGVITGSGNFLVENKMTINFTDTELRPANLNTFMILNGSYTYQCLGDSLILTKTMADADVTFKYRLKRVRN